MDHEAESCGMGCARPGVVTAEPAALVMLPSTGVSWFAHVTGVGGSVHPALMCKSILTAVEGVPYVPVVHMGVGNPSVTSRGHGRDVVRTHGRTRARREVQAGLGTRVVWFYDVTASVLVQRCRRRVRLRRRLVACGCRPCVAACGGRCRRLVCL